MRIRLPLIIVLAAALATASRAAGQDLPTRTLGRVFSRLKAGEPTAIAYFGGSITEANGYRVKTLQWFRERFPKAEVREINAAIGGTGSDLGAFRCQDDVIAHGPDLVFVEFNINDGSPTDDFHKATMEGIVRQLWVSKTRPEVVFLYTTDRSLDKARGSHPAVARHYGIPQLDLQPPLREALKRPDLPRPTPEQLKDSKLDWTQPGQVFMSDSVHPNDLGHSIYAETIIAYLTTQIAAEPSPPPTLPSPLIGDDFARTRLVAPTVAKLAGDWEPGPPSRDGRYRLGTINARKPGDALAFEFEGTAIGLFLDVQKDGGRFEWTIDDGTPARKKDVVDTAPGPFFPRHNSTMLASGLAAGRHLLKIRVLEERDATSTGNRLLIGYLMVAGVPE